MSRRATRSVVAGAAATLLTLALTTTLVGCGTIPTTAAGSQRDAQAPTAPADKPAPGAEQPGQGSSQDPTGEPQPSDPPTPEPTPVSFTSNVKDGKGGVKVNTLVNVKATDGSLATVALSFRGVTRQGKQIKGTVKGALSADKKSWTASERLEPSSTYTLTSTGKSVTGVAATEKSSFRTAQLTADQETFASIAPQPDSLGRHRHAGRAHLRRPGRRSRGLPEEPPRAVDAGPGGQLELAVGHRGPVPPQELVEAGHQGEGVGRHQRPRRGERGLRPEGRLDRVHRLQEDAGHPDQPEDPPGQGLHQRQADPDHPDQRRQARVGNPQRRAS